MKLILLIILIFGVSAVGLFLSRDKKEKGQVLAVEDQKPYWFLLHRKSNKEYLYQGEPGNIENSTLIKEFKVKTGRPGERPTPLPQLIGQEYWIITGKRDSSYSQETAPYFLTLNVPGWQDPPYGPSPYLECNGQCHWVKPGEFGLHGVAGVSSRLTDEDPGSSGCIRHSDEDITYLYNLLDPSKQEVRYYIKEL